MSGNTYSFITLSSTFLTWMQRTNNVVSELNNKVVKFDTSNSGKKLIVSANVTANGRSFISNANTVQKGTFIAQRNVTANGNSLIVNANTIHNGTTLFQRPVTANGNSLIVNANTVQKGTFIAQRPVTANGNSLIVNANTVQKGTFIAQRNLTANGNSFTINSNTTFNSSNTNIRGNALLVTSNIVSTSTNAFKFLGTGSGLEYTTTGAHRINASHATGWVTIRSGGQDVLTANATAVVLSAANTIVSPGATFIHSGSGAFKMYGANTNIRGGAFLVTSNTNITSNMRVGTSLSVGTGGTPSGGIRIKSSSDGTAVASSAVIDTDGGSQNRFYSYGADASTNGSWVFVSRRSDGTNSVNPFTLTSSAATVSANTTITGGLTLKGTTIVQRTLTANGNSLIVNANTVQKGTFIAQRNLTANGATLTVNANTTITGGLTLKGTTIVQRTLTANGNSLIVNANTVQKGTTLFQRPVTANGNSLIVNANTVQKGTFIAQRAFTANGVSATFTANVTISGANTNFGTSQLLSRGIVKLNGANTNVHGGTLFVSSNTMIVSNTHHVTGTHVARKGAPIKHIGLGSNTYTLVIGDNGYYLRAANTGGMTLTIPTNAAVAFPVGAEIVVVRTGGNNHLTFANTATVVMNYADGKKRIATRYSAATLKKVGTNVWDLVGALSA